MGPASVNILNKTFETLFDAVVSVPDGTSASNRPVSIVAIVKPRIEQFSLDFPHYPMLYGNYTAAIAYHFSLTTPEDVHIASWTIQGTGTREAEWNLTSDASIREVTETAMRNVAYAFMKDFQARPEVQDWLAHATLPPPGPPASERDVAPNSITTVTEPTPSQESFRGWKDFRSERPLQVQLAVGGTGGLQRGIGLGYHFDERFFAGIIHWFPESGDSLTREYYTSYGQDGMTSHYISNDQKDLIELRYSPFSIIRPFYISAGYFIDKGFDEHIVYDVRSRTIGSNVYVTGLDVTTHDKPVASLAFGAGINYVWSKGWSVSAGFLLALKRNQTDILVTATNPGIAPGDIEAFKQQIADEHRNISLGYLAVGYNF